MREGPPGESPRSWDLAAWAALAALLGVLLCRSWFEPDIWYHLALGRSILESGLPQPPEQTLLVQQNFVNIYWLFQVPAYLVHRAGGVPGTTLAVGLVWAAIAVLWVRVSGANRLRAFGPWLGLAVLLLAQVRFQARPEILSYLFLTLHILRHLRLDLRKPLTARDHAMFFVTQALWTNMHGYFFFGPLLVLLHLASAAAGGAGGGGTDRRAAVRRLAGLLGVVSLASFVTPFGAGAWRMAVTYAGFARAMRHEIAEFAPFHGLVLRHWLGGLFLVLWVATLATTILRLRRGPRDPFVAGLALLGLVISPLAVRNIPLLLILGAPLWRPTREPDETASAGRPGLRRTSCAAAAIVAVAIAFWAASDGFYRVMGGPVRTGIGLFPTAFAAGFLRHIEEAPFGGKIFNHPDDGGFLLFHRPGLAVYADSRFSDVGKVREYFAALFEAPAFFELDRRHRFDGVLLDIAKGQQVLLPYLLYSSWEIAYADLSRVFLVRGGAPSPVLRVYGGEDLGLWEEGQCAVRWVDSLAVAGVRPLLVAVLDQLSAAPTLPVPVVSRVLRLGLEGDGELLARGRRMASKAEARSPAEAAELRELLARAAVL